MAKMNHSDIQSTLDKVIRKLEEGKLDNNSALTMSKVIATKISAYKEQIKYKKMTGQPGTIEFFEK